MKLSNEELKNISGGISVWAVLGIISGSIFGVGTVDGYVRPRACNK